MREIIFRGKRVDNGEWVEGYYFAVNQKYYIAKKIFSLPEVFNGETEMPVIVDNKTTGQYTGLTDKNGKKIFEGDIVNYFNKDYLNHEIIFSKGCFMFRFISEYLQKIRQAKQEPIFSNVSVCGEVIGNIFDNPELLEV